MQVACFPAWLLTISALLLALPADARELVCEHPGDVLEQGSEVRRLHAAFDGVSERRIFSEVHYYDPQDPHLTVGMGHWIDGNLTHLMARIKADSTAWNELLDGWLSVMTAPMWKRFNQDSGTSGRSREDLDAGLSRLFCIGQRPDCVAKVHTPWTKRIGPQFMLPSNWFRAGWQTVGRYPDIALIQANTWIETVVLPGQSLAAEAGADSLGGTAVFASAHSSASSLSRSIAAMVRQVKAVPEGVAQRSADGAPDRLLADWKAVVAWAEYNKIKKGVIRPRMQSIWTTYFAGSWGTMPQRMDTIGQLKHSGCWMARGRFEKSAALRPDLDAKCNNPPLRPTVAVCERP
jgi:hypothetical protein